MLESSRVDSSVVILLGSLMYCKLQSTCQNLCSLIIAKSASLKFKNLLNIVQIDDLM